MGFNSNQTVHAADERIPAEALSFGASAIYKALRQALRRFGPHNAARRFDPGFGELADFSDTL